MDLRSSLAYSRVRHVEECPDIGPACLGLPTPEPYRHDVSTLVSEVPLEVSYGVLRWLAAEVRLPLRMVGVWPRYTTLGGAELPLATDGHHRRETLVGPADPWISLRIAGRAGAWLASTKFGVSLPLGRTEPDPFALGLLGLPHQHIQFGSGTVMPVLGGFVQRAAGPVELAASAVALVNFSNNRHGYRAPSRAFGSLRVTVPWLANSVRPYAALDMSLEASERWHGEIGHEGSSDRADLLAGGGVGWQVFPALAVDLGVRARVAKLSAGSALDYPGYAQLGGTWTFDTSSSTSPEGEAGNSNW